MGWMTMKHTIFWHIWDWCGQRLSRDCFSPENPGWLLIWCSPNAPRDARCMSAIWALDVTLLQLVWPVQILGVLSRCTPAQKPRTTSRPSASWSFWGRGSCGKAGRLCRKRIWFLGYFSDASFFGIKLFHESLGPVDIWDVFETYSKHLPIMSHNFPINPMVFVATLQLFFWSVTSRFFFSQARNTLQRWWVPSLGWKWQPRPAIWWVNHGLMMV